MKSDYCQNEKDGNLLVGGYYCVDIIIGLYSLFHSPTLFLWVSECKVVRMLFCCERE